MDWTIKEHSEYKKTLKNCPREIQDYIKNTLRSQMEEYPLTNAIELKNRLIGHYEQKIKNYRLIFKINLKTHVVYFLWIRPKPHVTERNWIS